MKRIARIAAMVVLFLLFFLAGVSRAQDKAPEIKPDVYTKLVHAQALSFQAQKRLADIAMQLQQQYQQQSQPWIEQNSQAVKEWNEAKAAALKEAKLDPNEWDVEDSVNPKFIKKPKPEDKKPAEAPKPSPQTEPSDPAKK